VINSQPKETGATSICGSTRIAEQALAGDGVQRPLRSRFPPRLATYAGGAPPLLLHRFLASLEDTVAVTRAAIPVERINGGVLLISGRDDQLWPSSQMADLVVARLHRYGFMHLSHHLSYEQAGHAIGTPYRSTTGLTRSVHPVTKIAYPMGGTPAGYARAQADSWPQALGFLDTHLKRLGQ